MGRGLGFGLMVGSISQCWRPLNNPWLCEWKDLLYFFNPMYKTMVDNLTPKENKLTNMIISFFSGGIIGFH